VTVALAPFAKVTEAGVTPKQWIWIEPLHVTAVVVVRPEMFLTLKLAPHPSEFAGIGLVALRNVTVLWQAIFGRVEPIGTGSVSTWVSRSLHPE
jgi:hypothetical protein